MNDNRQAALDIIFGEIRLSMELWRRHPGSVCAEEAAEILSAWAHAHRLRDASDPAWDALDALVRSDFPTLCDAALESDDPEEWSADFTVLLDNAEDALPGEEMEACANFALELFSRLDQAQLVAWAMQRLGDARAREWHRRWTGCDRLFRDNIIEFLPIHHYARMMAEQYRDDLPEFDADLALVTSKFGLLLQEQAEWDLDAEPSAAVMKTLAMFIPEFNAAAGAAPHTSKAGVLCFPDEESRSIDEVLRLFDTSKAQFAADTEGPEQPVEKFVAMKGAGWSATVSKRKEGAVVFVHDEEGMPLDVGVFFIGTLSETVRDGKAVFPAEALCAAVAAGGTPALRIGDDVLPGEWERRDEDDV